MQGEDQRQPLRESADEAESAESPSREVAESRGDGAELRPRSRPIPSDQGQSPE